MNGPPRARASRWQVRIGVFAVTVSLLLLPALLAARHLGVPGDEAERQRVVRALAAEAAPGLETEVARSFHGASLFGVSSWPDGAEARQEVLTRARLAAITAVLGLSLATYLVVLLARGRLQALAACGCLALLPPIVQEGHVLRPEVPAALFAAFAVLLLECLAQAVRSQRTGAVRVLGFVLCAAVASGLAVAAFPRHGAPLLVGGVVLTLGALQFGLRSVQVARRRGVTALPIRALNARLLPWTATALLTPAVTMVLLGVVGDGPSDGALPSAGADYWPASFALRLAFAAALALGGFTMLLRTGQAWRRRGRIGPDLVLLVAAAVALASGLPQPEGEDRVLLAVPTAVLLAEACWALAMLAQWRRLRA